jgi:hypothetical protein
MARMPRACRINPGICEEHTTGRRAAGGSTRISRSLAEKRPVFSRFSTRLDSTGRRPVIGPQRTAPGRGFCDSLGGSLAIDLAATDHRGVIGWIGFAVFAVLSGVVGLLNTRALRRDRTDLD